ncbi:glycine cleavage system protein GcvH [Pseudomonas sp. NW5]|uniref:glycine cleavage system protein GcvH n=1 Tax=Pseudomonas sp. NW5 TaxID=2934934 RepID=UPI00201FB837|nr:glycine cleavage system protein GcvH [Pseudomonas sp. NW5]MCL7462701.1 glycine cleavage system protein GcvH [Pseudomonas sp. NW5]
MSHTPADLHYTDSHSWARLEADGSLSVGITDHAQTSLGDVVFVELPEPGRRLSAGEQVGVVESVKTASDIYAPLAGTITAVNEALADAPERINEDPYGQWIYRLQPDDLGALQTLLDAAGYQASCVG